MITRCCQTTANNQLYRLVHKRVGVRVHYPSSLPLSWPPLCLQSSPNQGRSSTESSSRQCWLRPWFVQLLSPATQLPRLWKIVNIIMIPEPRKPPTLYGRFHPLPHLLFSISYLPFRPRSICTVSNLECVRKAAACPNFPAAGWNSFRREQFGFRKQHWTILLLFSIMPKLPDLANRKLIGSKRFSIKSGTKCLLYELSHTDLNDRYAPLERVPTRPALQFVSSPLPFPKDQSLAPFCHTVSLLTMLWIIHSNYMSLRNVSVRFTAPVRRYSRASWGSGTWQSTLR